MKETLGRQKQENEEMLHQIQNQHERDMDKMKTNALFQYREGLEQSQRPGKPSTSEKKSLEKFPTDFDNAFLSTITDREIPKKRITSVERAIQTLENIEISSTPSDQVMLKYRVGLE